MLNVLVLSAVLEYLSAELQLNYLAVASDPGKVFGWSSGLALMYLPQWVVADKLEVFPTQASCLSLSFSQKR
ncbi:hypothetical protein OIU78_028523 [Salix suchowensis]|nr:hypothetical protein OIU78_028523 [Salix suchowensis]